MLLRARVSVLDRPGALLSMAKVIADSGGNVVDIEVLATADWAVAVTGGTYVHATPGAPQPLPDSMPELVGPLPRRGLVKAADERSMEVVGVGWAGAGADRLYLGRREGPTFLQVELVHLRRVVELAATLSSGITSMVTS